MQRPCPQFGIIEENTTIFSETNICPYCKKSFQTKKQLQANKYIIMKMNFNRSAIEENKKYELKIKGIPNTNITVGDETYEFAAMVQHISQSINSNNLIKL